MDRNTGTAIGIPNLQECDIHHTKIVMWINLSTSRWVTCRDPVDVLWGDADPGFAEKSRCCGAYRPRYHWSMALAHLTSRPTTTARPAVPAVPGSAPALPPSVARVAARTRLSAELLAAILEVE
ncbi:hypothetical protein ThrDRAFT_04763, partial [Frankia casuarinae]